MVNSNIKYPYVKPIYHPGFHNFRVSAELIRAVNSRVNGTVVMYRTVSGLRAPVTCTIITIDPQTVLSIGSCTYPDLCDLLYTLLGVKDSPDCPEWLVEEGFTCKCPWDFPAGRSVNLEEEIEVTDLAQYGVAWLVSGNFEVNVKASHGTQPAICLDIKAGVSQKPGGK